MRGGSRLLIAFVIALLAAFWYFGSRSNTAQEITLGSQAMSEIARQYGGEIDQPVIANYVEEIGERIVHRSAASQSPYQYEFHVLADPLTVDAFALPGGQVAITMGLLAKLTSEAELAAVLSHEVGHIVGRHGTEHLAKQRFARSLVKAIGSSPFDPSRPYVGEGSAAVTSAVAQVVTMRFDREDELEADALAVRFMDQAQYDPNGMAELMQRLAKTRRGRSRPAFFSTHPNSEDRLARIRALISDQNSAGGERGEDRYEENVLRFLKND
jgi:predicted Zn-dependent protease